MSNCKTKLYGQYSGAEHYSVATGDGGGTGGGHVATYKLDGVGPVDNRPSTYLLPQFVKKKIPHTGDKASLD